VIDEVCFARWSGHQEQEVVGDRDEDFGPAWLGGYARRAREICRVGLSSRRRLTRRVRMAAYTKASTTGLRALGNSSMRYSLFSSRKGIGKAKRPLSASRTVSAAQLIVNRAQPAEQFMLMTKTRMLHVPYGDSRPFPPSASMAARRRAASHGGGVLEQAVRGRSQSARSKQPFLL
jgi:hypothetical protein